MPREASVLVVGAGLTGLTLANELWMRAVPCRSIDRGSAPRPEEGVLAEHLIRLGGDIERDTELIGLTQDDDGVIARLRCGDGSDEVFRFSWVVGCDGADSATRRLLDSAHRGHRVRRTSYARGRTFLAGRAARAHGPTTRQGVHGGIEDAFNLAWKLALVQTGKADPRLLASYAIERREVFRTASRMRRSGAAGLKPWPSYWHSPIVADASARPALTRIVARAVSLVIGAPSPTLRAPRAGDRAPDVDVLDPRSGDSVRLLEGLRDSAHQLLLFAGADDRGDEVQHLTAIAALVRGRHDGLIRSHLIHGFGKAADWRGSRFSDPEAVAHRRYGACRGGLVLVRPDGYIGFRSVPARPDRLIAYLDALFVRPAVRHAQPQAARAASEMVVRSRRPLGLPQAEEQTEVAGPRP